MELGNGPKGIALLRVCRQIFAEAADIPLRQNIFFFTALREIKRSFKVFKKRERNQITSLRFELHGTDARPSLWCDNGIRSSDALSSKHLPGLKKVVIHIFSCSQMDEVTRQETENRLYIQMKEMTPGMLVDTKIEWETPYLSSSQLINW
jgi:hypothetical protein